MGDITCITHTSGMTDAPIGAMLTHAALVENGRDAAEVATELHSDDVTFAVMALLHVDGMWHHLHPCFAASGTTIIGPSPKGNLMSAFIKRAPVH